MQDKFSAIWVSHSSISDFLKCPRGYYLKNVYKNPQTGHKMTIMSPPLALGQAVHEVIESLSILPTKTRFSTSLISKFEQIWTKVTGRLGGFTDPTIEQHYKHSGQDMLKMVMENPGPLLNQAVKIKQQLPYFWLSEADNIILCGKIDWLEYLGESDSVHIIDFKTGKKDEQDNSLQLPIYFLLAKNTQSHQVTRASYWYLQRNNDLTAKPLPDEDSARKNILKIAKQIKLARQLNIFKCPHDGVSPAQRGCYACRPFEAVLKGEGELVGVDDIRRDVYVVNQPQYEQGQSEIL